MMQKRQDSKSLQDYNDRNPCHLSTVWSCSLKVLKLGFENDFQE
eukprot:11822.XXX_668563_668694_1 [CDS] Oithona nana genome sequencing.